MLARRNRHWLRAGLGLMVSLCASTSSAQESALVYEGGSGHLVYAGYANEGETNAVAVVGRVLPLPEHLGHNPEHGTAIEQVAPVGDNLTLVASKEHDELSWSGGGSELAE